MGSGKGMNKRVALLRNSARKQEKISHKTEVKELINSLKQEEILFDSSKLKISTDAQQRLEHATKVFNKLVRTFNALDDICISDENKISHTLDVLKYPPNRMDGVLGLCHTQHNFSVIIVNTPLLKENIYGLLPKNNTEKTNHNNEREDNNDIVWTDITEILNERNEYKNNYACLLMEAKNVILLHELGHYLMDTNSANSSPSSSRIDDKNLEELRTDIFTKKILEELDLDSYFTDTFSRMYIQEEFNILLNNNENNLRKTTRQLEKILPTAYDAVKHMKSLLDA